MPVLVGTSGWSYPHWRGRFYPPGLPPARELAWLAGQLPTVEVNATFYRLQRPTTFAGWRAAVPAGFVFAVKGSRYLTHVRRLRDVDVPLANFLASGLLALGPALGPVLWQLPPQLGLDVRLLDDFLARLPRTVGQAAVLAAGHDARLDGRAVISVAADDDAERPLRHALEVRHPSFAEHADGFLATLRRHDVAVVTADTAGHFPVFDEPTSAALHYVRLHGATELYVGGYPPDSLDAWAGRCLAWAAPGRVVHVYLDNDAAGHAPEDALGLLARLASRTQDGDGPGAGA